MRIRVVAVLALLVLLVLVSCGGSSTTEEAEPTTVPIPETYAGKTSPISNDQASIDAGKEMYTQNCAACHGESGAGDGPAGQALVPPAADLTDEEFSDDYLFWRISEGGVGDPYNSSMPAWKTILSEDQIWQVISYIHTLEK